MQLDPEADDDAQSYLRTLQPKDLSPEPTDEDLPGPSGHGCSTSLKGKGKAYRSLAAQSSLANMKSLTINPWTDCFNEF